jgi:chemotaxis regulatin CheY-phosphate phosphatase CheZ
MDAPGVLFNFLDARVNSFAVVPIPAEAVEKHYIDGSALKKYVFALQTIQNYSQTTDDVNTEAMFIMSRWQSWIDEQEEAHNYPDFGEKCSGYRLVNGSNMPTLAGVNRDECTAKYQFIATLYYMEEK